MLNKNAMQVSISDNHQTLGDLLLSISELSSHIAEDGVLYSEDVDFPLAERKIQVESLSVLIKTLLETLSKIETEITYEELQVNAQLDFFEDY